MAAPNLAGMTNIKGKVTGSSNLSTTLSTTIVTCPVDKVLKVNTIIAANIDGVDSADLTVGVYNGVDNYYLAYQIPIQGQSSMVVLSKENSIYLEEGNEIRAGASVTGDLSLLVSYDEIGDD
jgi:hypothetical protein